MITSEIIDYIKAHQASGTSNEEIVRSLTEIGWQPQDIQEALALVAQTPSPANPSPTIKPNRSRLLVSSLILVPLVVIIGGAAYAYTAGIFDRSMTSQTTPTPKASTATYTSPDKDYQFSYLENWKVSSTGTMLMVSSAEKASLATDSLEAFLSADALVSSTMYYTGTAETIPGVTVTGMPEPKSHDEQAKDLMTSIATDGAVTPITVGNLSGYATANIADDGSSYNIALIGTNAIYLIQFPQKTSQGELSEGQRLVLDSFTEI